MNLNFTSIEDAWGEPPNYTNPRFQEAQLDKYMTPKSSQIRHFHPNNIVESVPTRIDVAIYDPNVIDKLYNKTPENRTLFVTDLIRRFFLGKQKSNSPQEQQPLVNKKEYYVHPTCTSFIDSLYDRTGDMLMIVLFIVLLVDKLLSILKNS